MADESTGNKLACPVPGTGDTGSLDFMDEVGWEVNAVARDFNKGCGNPQRLQYAVRRLTEAYERIHELRQKGYPHAS